MVLNCLAFYGLSADPLSGSTRISFHRLTLNLPGTWKSREQGKILQAINPQMPGTLLMISEPSDLRTWTARGYLENGIKGMESQEKRSVMKVFPDSVAEGLTASGTGFAFQTRVTKGQDGSVRYTAYYAFAAGARFQAFIIIASRAEDLQILLKAFSPSFDKLDVRLPEVAVSPQNGKQHGFFNYRLIQPSHWRPEESPYANLSVYSPVSLPGSSYVFGNSNDFVVEYELQPGNPVSPVAALSSYLSKRSTTAYKSWTRPEDALRIARIDEMQLSDGRIIVGLALQQDNDDRFYLGAWMIPGPGYSLIIAAGFKLFRYDLIKRGSTAAVEHKAWHAFYESLPRIAATVRWRNDNLKRNPAAEGFLLQKKRFRYLRQASISGSSISVYTSNRIEWDFHPGNRVNFKIDKFSSFDSYDFNPNRNAQDLSSGYLTRENQGKDSTFQVWSSGGADYLIVMRPAGVATFHPLTTGAHFTIDGFQDGCCR
ncbi:MAG: hypothetical protein KDK25_14395 [Leptospiraceae bacterium]|nr:hypothetical protein [Leptospiraceae bacterium]